MTHAAQTASEYAAQINAESRARAEAEGWTLVGTLVEDADFWAEMGIHTGEQLRRSLAIGEYSDTYKEINGIRPRWVNFDDVSTEEIEAMVTDLLETEERARKAEEARKVEAEARRAEALTCTPLTHNPFAALAGLEV